MKNKTLTLSIVIPAYNEQDYLKACLDSVAAQAVLPDEVIVVDNNSTDDTVKIARSYGFVRLLHEPNQHQSFAQKTGFNAARSDIIGRIDADSILPADWVRRVKQHFAGDPQLTAITGSTTPYDISVKSVGTRVFRFYIGLAGRLAGHRMLWGADCAVRRSDWLKIRDRVLTRGDIWEDYDLSFCLAPLGKIELVNDMDVASSFRAVHKSLITQTRYQVRAVRTFHIRTSLLKTVAFFAVWSTMFLMYLLTRLDKNVLKPLIISAGQPAETAAEFVPRAGE